MISVFILNFVVSTLLSIVLTPLVIRLAVLIGAVDKPDERKIHKKVMPRLGGVATFFSFSITLAISHFVFPEMRLDEIVSRGNFGMIGLSFFMILMLGVGDDVWTLKPKQKFLVQFLAGSLLYLAGFRIEQITNPFGGGTLVLGPLSYPLTVFWMVGITNAFNLIDGLDGLASGIALIAGLSITAISVFDGDIETAAVTLILVGSVLGFLKYNFNPARIFLGDSGSLFLGFMLSVLSIESSTKGSTAFSLLIPILVLGVPIMDTLLAMLRRVLRSFIPGQASKSPLKKLSSMFLPDKRHIHHQLLAKGLSHRNAVIVLYIVSIALGLSALLVTAGSLNTFILLIGVASVISFGIRILGYREMAFIRNGTLLRLYSRAFLGSAVPLIILDALSVGVAFVMTQILLAPAGFGLSLWRSMAFAMLVITIIQLLTYTLGGLYKRTVSLFGLGDLLQMFKTTITGVALTVVALVWLPLLPRGTNTVDFALLYFYFLITLVIGSRLIFHALNYVFHRELTDGKKSLIYGANRDGLITLQSLIAQGNARGAFPLGFLDDDPSLEGKYLDGYPIFGGHWKLERLINKCNIGEVILAGARINPLVLGRIRKVAGEYKIPIRVLRIKFEMIESEAGAGADVSEDSLDTNTESLSANIEYYGISTQAV